MKSLWCWKKRLYPTTLLNLLPALSSLKQGGSVCCLSPLSLCAPKTVALSWAGEVGNRELVPSLCPALHNHMHAHAHTLVHTDSFSFLFFWSLFSQSLSIVCLLLFFSPSPFYYFFSKILSFCVSFYLCSLFSSPILPTLSSSWHLLSLWRHVPPHPRPVPAMGGCVHNMFFFLPYFYYTSFMFRYVYIHTYTCVTIAYNIQYNNLMYKYVAGYTI